MKHFVYILKSLVKDRHYIGCTGNVQKRLVEHNAGKTKSTKPFRPWEVVHVEEFGDKLTAYKREWHLKHPVGYLDKLKILKNLK